MYTRRQLSLSLWLSLSRHSNGVGKKQRRGRVTHVPRHVWKYVFSKEKKKKEVALKVTAIFSLRCWLGVRHIHT